jgi:hypothetical protein
MLKKAGKKTGLAFAALLVALMTAVLVFSGGLTVGETTGNTLPRDKLDAYARGFSTHLPIIALRLESTDLYDKDNPPRATLWVFDGGSENRLTDTPTDVIRSATANYRGTASLTFPKKQYKLILYNYYVEPRDYPFLGLPPASEWVLHSPYADKSLIRNWFAYELAAMVLDWQPRGKPVQLFVQCEPDDMFDYQGVYLLCESVTVGESRLDLGQFSLRQTDSIDFAGGGYLYQRDRVKGDSSIHLIDDDAFRLSYPKQKDMTASQKDAYVNEVMFFYNFLTKKGEYARLTGDDWDYWNYIDVESFIDYFLVAELVKCADAGWSSTFMYRHVGGKLVLGPLWDSDMSMGNFTFADSTYDTFLTLFGTHFGRDMIGQLSFDSSFATAFAERWLELRQSVWTDDAVLGLFDAMVEYMAPAAAQNIERWPYDGEVYMTFYPQMTAATWEEEIEQTRAWLVSRLEWLDANIPLLMG